MTDGHRHRHLRLAPDSLLRRLLRGVTVHRSDDLPQVEASRFVYRPDPDANGRYVLSLLGWLHGLVGLTLIHEEDDDG